MEKVRHNIYKKREKNEIDKTTISNSIQSVWDRPLNLISPFILIVNLNNSFVPDWQKTTNQLLTILFFSSLLIFNRHDF